MKYIIAAMTIINDLHFADGRKCEHILGGGVYCVGGIKPFDDSICYVTAAGPDFDTHYGDYFRNNGVSTTGVQRVLPNTHYNIVEYYPDGRWYEYSVYGKDYSDKYFPETQIKGRYVADQCGSDTMGIYTESGIEEIFWLQEELSQIRQAAPNAKLMWEVPTYNITNPEQRPYVIETARKSDIFSINLPEGEELFGVSGYDAVVNAIHGVGVPCFLRCGTKGAAMVQNGQAMFVPSVGVERSVDPTGCGNCSTAAALYGFAEGLPSAQIVANANVAASYNALQLGPYPAFAPKLQDIIRKQADDLAASVQ